MATDCGEVVDEECKGFLEPQSPERQKAMIQELKKQQDELNKMQSNAGAKSDGKADPKKAEADSKER